MLEVKKCVAQSAPPATTLTLAYALPTGVSYTTITLFTVCNRGMTNTKFRLSLRLQGAAENTKQYLYYNEAIPNESTIPFDEQTIEMQAGDELWVYAGTSDLSFNFFGNETTQ
jgi:hypothetical protein